MGFVFRGLRAPANAKVNLFSPPRPIALRPGRGPLPKCFPLFDTVTNQGLAVQKSKLLCCVGLRLNTLSASRNSFSFGSRPVLMCSLIFLPPNENVQRR